MIMNGSVSLSAGRVSLFSTNPRWQPSSQYICCFLFSYNCIWHITNPVIFTLKIPLKGQYNSWKVVFHLPESGYSSYLVTESLFLHPPEIVMNMSKYFEYLWLHLHNKAKITCVGFFFNISYSNYDKFTNNTMRKITDSMSLISQFDLINKNIFLLILQCININYSLCMTEKSTSSLPEMFIKPFLI